MFPAKTVDVIIEILDFGFQVERRNDGRLRAEEVMDLIPHKLIYRLQFQFGGEAVLHAFDDRKLSFALFQLFADARTRN